MSQSVPYEASVDAQGYLTSLTVTLPTFASTAGFSDLGKPVSARMMRRRRVVPRAPYMSMAAKRRTSIRR
ncbi:hypothetical protein JNW91_27740 [Micromonospora sp. STR1_7]|uniref:Uncharacterized protein n=1 Tax=Micromonospora parastrephiae TaxID=2806101 RepID=A0ABS1Y165_9ACTN|nr:hypothetical protein [Micromonospora parastrephiae]MBM0235253.1 hypothetical protein [Micromonospora parastrephiae]